MDCEEIKKIIPRYYNHTAAEEEIKKVEEHLCICHNCRTNLSELMDKESEPDLSPGKGDSSEEIHIIPEGGGPYPFPGLGEGQNLNSKSEGPKIVPGDETSLEYVSDEEAKGTAKSSHPAEKASGKHLDSSPAGEVGSDIEGELDNDKKINEDLQLDPAINGSGDSSESESFSEMEEDTSGSRANLADLLFLAAGVIIFGFFVYLFFKG